jgi:hypothetical protein
MKKPMLSLPPKTKPKTIVQQNTDFTAEGSPPPGKVGTEVPLDVATQVHDERQKAKEDQAAEHARNAKDAKDAKV